MKLNKRMLFGIVSILLAALIAFIGIPALLNRTNTSVSIVRVKSAIEKGAVINAEQVEMAEVSSFGLPSGVATEYAQVVGKYALVDFVPGDYFLPSKVSATAVGKDAILGKLIDGKLAVSVSAQSLAGTLSNKIRTDDIVSIYTTIDGKVVQPEELQFVRIIAVTNSNGTNLEDVIGDESRMAATITFLVSESQAEKLIQVENSGRMHLALVARSDRERAKELLVKQEEILAEINLENNELDFDFGEAA